MFPYTQKTVLVDFIASFCDGLIGLGALSVWLHPAFGVALILPRLVPHFFTSGAAGRGVRGPHQQAPHHPPAGLPGGQLGTFGDANFGWLRLLLGWLSQKKLMEGNWVPPRWRGGLR